MEEQTLLDKCTKGDVHAFEELVEQYQQGIINHAYSMFLNREDALDMAQETFIKAFNAIASFNRQSSFKTWLFRIATNVCLDELRRRKRRAATVSLTAEEDGGDSPGVQIDVADASADPAEAAQQAFLRHAIETAIGELDTEYRTAIVLREIEGMDYNEIAKTMGCSLGTVKSRISRARAQLREKLMQYRELF